MSTLRRRYGRAKPGHNVTELRKALTDLLEFVTSGRRYETRNPYTIPEVDAAFKALGKDWRGR